MDGSGSEGNQDSLEDEALRRAVWCGLAFLWIGAPDLPLAAQERITPHPKLIQLQLHRGETQDVYVNLGADNRPDIDLKAELTRKGTWPDPDRIRLDLIDNDSQVRGPEAVIRHIPGGRVLWLQAAVSSCAPVGLHHASIAVSPIEQGSIPAGQTVGIPVSFEILASSGCAVARARSFLLSVPLGVCFFFVLTSVTHSRRLSIEELTKRLKPLCWDESGNPVVKSSEDQVRATLAEQLNTSERAKRWLSANPLRFGWRAYAETVEIHLNDQIEHLTVHFVDPEEAKHLWENHLGAGRGRLFARAEARGVTLFGVLGEDDRLSGLSPVDAGIDFNGNRKVGKLDLVKLSSPRHSHGAAAGWRLEQAQIRRSHRA